MAIVKKGMHRALEEEANRLLRESLRAVTKHSEKRDILTPWKEKDRRSREVYVDQGVPDRAIRQGMYHRAANARQTYLNSRDGIAARGGKSLEELRRYWGQDE